MISNLRQTGRTTRRLKFALDNGYTFLTYNMQMVEYCRSLAIKEIKPKTLNKEMIQSVGGYALFNYKGRRGEVVLDHDLYELADRKSVNQLYELAHNKVIKIIDVPESHN